MQSSSYDHQNPETYINPFDPPYNNNNSDQNQAPAIGASPQISDFSFEANHRNSNLFSTNSLQNDYFGDANTGFPDRDTNSTSASQRKNTRKKMSTLNSLAEDQSVTDFKDSSFGYSLSQVGTNVNGIIDEEEEDSDVHLSGAHITGSENVTRKGSILIKSRWGTQRHKSGKPKPSRTRTLKWRHHNNNTDLDRKNTFGRTSSSRKNDDSIDSDDLNHKNEEDKDPRNRKSEQRKIFFNTPLPQEMLDADGLPLTEYARNKIRTTKYTPLTFLPKNLYIQFRNVANVYFLILIILGFFTIFGVSNPGLSMVPLIVIVAITALKDAIEDSRRTGSDMEVNNSITHILSGVHNNNTSADSISLWRKFKKLNTKLLFAFIKILKRNFTTEGRQEKKVDHINNLKTEQHSGDDFKERKSFESYNSRLNDNEYDAYDKEQIPMDDLNSMGELENPFRGPSFVDPNIPASNNCKFEKKYWKEVQVGDLVRIHNDEELPADIVILSTSDSDGACYVETKNLDGETNLKVRQSLKCSTDLRRSRDAERSKFWIESEGPHTNLYSYQGVCKYYNQENEICQDPITINNILLRGCFLRNTKWVIGIVVFTGSDTKIMLNSGITPTKVSRMSRELNFSVFMNFLLLFILCFVAGLVNGIYYNKTGTSRDLYEFGTIGSTSAINGIITFFVALILYSSLVPISLYISIEIIKTAQAFFIYSDVKMYYSKLDFPCTPKAWNISDDLGQIEYIFSDKTGTLTQNIMEFKKCTINGVSYGRAYTEALAGLRKRQGINVVEEGRIEKEAIANDKQNMMSELAKLGKNSQFYEDNLTFISSDYVRDLSGERGPKQQRASEHFMLCLALCHSVLAEPDKKNIGRIALKAQSPDESALVGTARDVGFAFVGRTKKGVIVEVQGVEKEYQILNTLEFNSTRKRMSAIIKIPPLRANEQPRALLICKGADSIIYSRLLKTNQDPKLSEKTALHLEEYATEGLRTLCIAQRELTWDTYEKWNKKHEEAAASLENREEKMEEVADEIERELTLLGGTAIEDRLQDGVSDSIEILGEAGIKLWVLTGDKVETAINIGFSCNLLNNDMDLLVIKTSGDDAIALAGLRENASPEDIVTTLIEKYLQEKFNMTGSMEELQKAIDDHNPPSGNFGIVIDGDALKIALKDEYRMKFLLLCKACRAVLCCRVSPAQKAAVVSLVKNTLDVMTLAIGDGSNDVAMIQAADVGVGIAGEEGRQAVMSSDYAIGQFRYLTRLLLVHGRWSYKRLAEMIPCFFFKNVIFTLALFWYGIFSDFDGSYLFEYTYLMFYNLAFTSLPVIFLGIFDQDVSDVVSLVVPQLYRSGILRSEWTNKKFLLYMADAFYQSLISFFFPYLVFYTSGFVSSNGLTLTHRYWIGCYVTSIAVVSCDIYIIMHQYRWDWLSSFICFLSIMILFGWTGIWSSSTYSGEFYKAAAQIYGAPSFWACLFVGILACLLPRLTYDVILNIFKPRDVDIIRECILRGDFKHYPPDYDPTDTDQTKIKWNPSLTPSFSTNENSYSHQQVNKSTTTINTLEIPMDFIESEDGNRRFSQRIERPPFRTSLDETREEMISNHELAVAPRARTSLELPGIETASALLKRASLEAER